MLRRAATAAATIASNVSSPFGRRLNRIGRRHVFQKKFACEWHYDQIAAARK